MQFFLQFYCNLTLDCIRLPGTLQVTVCHIHIVRTRQMTYELNTHNNYGVTSWFFLCILHLLSPCKYHAWQDYLSNYFTGHVFPRQPCRLPLRLPVFSPVHQHAAAASAVSQQTDKPYYIQIAIELK